MKKKLEKKAEKLRRKKIHEILDVVLDINTTQPRQEEKTGHKPTAFFSFSGHTSYICADVYEHGWSIHRGRRKKSYEAYADNSFDHFSPDKMLEKLREERELLKRAGQV